MNWSGGSYEDDPTQGAIFGGGGASSGVDSFGDFSGAFEADYYRESNDVVRGVTMNVMAQDVPDLGSAWSSGFPAGDFYRDPDDVCKGVSLGAALDVRTCLDDPPLPGSLQKFAPGGLEKFDQGFESIDTIGQFCRAGEKQEEFTEAHVPPSVPTGPFAKLVDTTLYISTSTLPHHIGNALRSLLGDKVTATITKVSREKFAIKADAFAGKTMCSLKVRVYKMEEQDRYAVEVQKRSGDIFAFRQVYDEVAKCLEERFSANMPGKLGREATSWLPPPPPASDALDGAEAAWEQAGPLLDMAASADRADLQAEAAAELADMAQDCRAASAFCAPDAFEAIKMLVQTDQLDVAYPTARLLHSLAARPEAKQCFADDALLSGILDKVQSTTLAAFVKNKYVQVLESALPRCAPALQPAAAEKVGDALVKAMTSSSVAEPLRRSLQEAHFTFNRKCPGL